MKIINEIYNQLLNRKEIVYEIEHSGATPTKEKVKDDIARHEKINPELVVVEHIYSYYGKRKSKIIAYAYNSVDDLKRMEIKKTKKVVEEKKG